MMLDGQTGRYLLGITWEKKKPHGCILKNGMLPSVSDFFLLCFVNVPPNRLGVSATIFVRNWAVLMFFCERTVDFSF
jgi:hypothetical protein